MRRMIIAGGTGFLGQTLAAHFLSANWDVVILTRSPGQPNVLGRTRAWDARSLGSWQKEFNGAAAIINLAGKSVNCRYHTRNRREILASRVESTNVVGQAIGVCTEPPPVWLNASTATIYRHTFGAPWDESGEIGATPEAKDAFSVEVARAWEVALRQAQTPRTRKVAMRTAMVLGFGKNSVFPALRRMARIGLGGTMGSGRQFVSWIHEKDFCRTVEMLIEHPGFAGPVNLAAPHPLPNREMMGRLRRVCRAPFGMPASGWMLEVGAFFLGTETELIIKSRHVVPSRLLASGFKFRYPTIQEAFEELNARAGCSCPKANAV